MHLSYNELIVLSEKAYMGLHLNIGEVDRIANMVAELELIGFNGIQRFANIIANIKPHNITTDCITNTDNAITVDLKNQSVLCHLPNILYYGRNCIGTNQTFCINITNASDVMFAYGELGKIPTRGYSVKANWNDPISAKQYTYILNKFEQIPNLYIKQFSPDNDLQITIAKNQFPKPINDKFDQHLSAKQIDKLRYNSLKNGVKVMQTDFNILKQYVNKKMVASSEQSSMGAGGV